MTEIKKIYDNDYSIRQYYKDGWKCEIDSEIPMTMVVEVINMLDATGEDEYKDYPVVFSVGMLNKNIHKSIQESIDCYPDDTPNTDDILSYYGMNCYLDEVMYEMDSSNKNLKKDLSIDTACISNYECRFTKKQKQYLKFKTEEAAFNFAEKLVLEYGNTIMTLVGFYLDRPVNLVGQTGWDQTEKLEKGE